MRPGQIAARRWRVAKDPIACTVVNTWRPGADPPPPPGLDITQRVVDGTLIVTVAGEVDPDTAPALTTAINDCITQAGGRPCVLDLTAVTFLDSAGLTALLEATIHAKTNTGPCASWSTPTAP
jgi:anti-anti-sigma factor